VQVLSRRPGPPSITSSRRRLPRASSPSPPAVFVCPPLREPIIAVGAPIGRRRLRLRSTVDLPSNRTSFPHRQLCRATCLAVDEITRLSPPWKKVRQPSPPSQCVVAGSPVQMSGPHSKARYRYPRHRRDGLECSSLEDVVRLPLRFMSSGTRRIAGEAVVADDWECRKTIRCPECPAVDKRYLLLRQTGIPYRAVGESDLPSMSREITIPDSICRRRLLPVSTNGEPSPTP